VDARIGDHDLAYEGAVGRELPLFRVHGINIDLLDAARRDIALDVASAADQPDATPAVSLTASK
jgi:hypothetical protein